MDIVKPVACQKRLPRNIDRTGRLVRAGIGLVLLLAAVATHATPWLAGVLGLSGLFVLFEAWRGWCALRACGVRTPF